MHIKLKRDNLNQFVELSRRYFELYPNKEIEKKIFSGFVTISYAHDDLNTLYERYLHDSLDIDSFYHIVVKVDIIRETFREILKLYDFKEEDVYGIKGSYNRDIIDFFVAIRSISLAHPQNTNRHGRFGFDGDIWLEDVRKQSDLGGAFPSEDSLESADFVLLLVRSINDDDLRDTKEEKQGINLDKEVFHVVRVIEQSISILNGFLINKIDEKEAFFKNELIIITDSLDDNDFKTLFNETKKRYPSLIEETNDGSPHYWDLANIKELLYFTKKFCPDVEFEQLLVQVIDSYHKQLQEMKLGKREKETEKLKDDIYNLLYPSLRILEIKSGKDFFYSKSKIYDYLPRSLSTSAPQILVEKEIYSYDWFAGIKKTGFGMNSSNTGFGIYQLMYVVENFPEFNFKYVNADNTAYTDKELYFQFIIKVFKYNRKYKDKIDTNESKYLRDL